MDRKLWLTVAVAVVCARTSEAFTLETVATTGCHEHITLAALERAGWPKGAAAPATTPADETLASNLQFHPPAHADGWTLAILIGVRDNDLGGFSPSNLPELAAVQNGEGEQHSHCLRELDDSGDGADQRALDACRAFIVSEVAAALGEADALDPTQTEPHRVDLAYQDEEVALARYAFHLGRAAHAMEDGFAHTFRTPDFRHVQSVLNYIGPNLEDGYRPDRDGYPHQSSMDSCDPADPQAAARTEAATEAVADLLGAVNGADGRAARLEAVNAVLDRWLSYPPGCRAANDWCGHAPPPQSGCSATAGALFALVGLFALVSLRRRRARPGALTLAMLTLALGVATAARAEEPAKVETAVAPETSSPRQGVLHAAVGASFDNPGANVTVGARLKVNRRITLGLDFELSPWLDLISGRPAPGTLNAYGTVSFLWGSAGPLEVRTALDLGTSLLLFKAEGARNGAVGLFLGASLIQLSLGLTDRLRLELSPEIAVAVPELHGVPLAYRQYRVTMGLAWSF